MTWFYNVGDLIDALNALPITAETDLYISDMEERAWSVLDVFIDDDGDVILSATRKSS